MSSTKRHKGQLIPLSESLGRSLGRGFLNFTAQKLRVFEVWDQVVGETDKARTRPEVLHDGRLTVLVPGPAWLERFSYKKALWLEKLNNELADQAVVEDIIFKVGDFSPPT